MGCVAGSAEHRKQRVVEGEDLHPVGVVGSVCVAVDCLNGCLDLVWARSIDGQAFPDEVVAFVDRCLLP